MSNISEKTKSNVTKITDGILETPRKLLGDMTAAVINVEDGSLLRLRVTVTTYVVFGKSSTLPVPTVTTTTAIELLAGTHILAVSGKNVRASTNPVRSELIS